LRAGEKSPVCKLSYVRQRRLSAQHRACARPFTQPAPGRRTALAAGARAQHLAQLPAQLPAQLRGQVAGGRAARGRGLIDEAQELGLVAVDQRQQLRVLLAQLLRAGYRVGLGSACPAPARRL
jgi:hypothetical protein